MALSPVRRVAIALAVASGLALPSCDTGSDPVGPGQVWTVLYAVEITGPGTVTKITYDDGSGASVAVAEPRPGWTTTLFLPPGATIALRAQGGVSDGRLRVLVDARTSRLPPLVRVADCTGTTSACDLEIPRETLP